MAHGWYPLELRQKAHRLSAHCRNFSQSDDRRAIWQVTSTAIPFLFLAAAMFALEPYVSWFLILLMAIPAGALLVRLFAIQHDCGHASYFSSSKYNDALGAIISLLTFTPYYTWRRSHALHHASSGNLHRRGIGDIETVTVSEYQAMTSAGKLRYRFMRNPIVSLIIGPPVYFLILQRTPLGANLPMKETWREAVFHNIGLLVLYGALIWFLGFLTVAKIVLPVVIIASWIGGFLFFVQHQFEETLWEGADEWDAKIAALKGSSHLILPGFVNWFTCDIGLHHIHHLCSRIPNYRLRECMLSEPALQDIAPKLTLWKAITGVHRALWDEKGRKLISFRQYREVFSG
jgi:acyl-lipid omega-6 desaturase (Delta-12 desaturase)